MFNFFLYCILWTLALYGFIDLVKMGVNSFKCRRIESNGIYVIVAAKNQEHQIEGFLRSVIFRILYGKDEYVENIIVTDLDSVDNTKQILENLAKDYDEIKSVEWDDCKRMLDDLE